MPSPQEVSLAVRRLQWRHHRTANQRLAALGLSLPQWDVLRHLERNPDASLHDLAVLTFQTDPSMGTLAARMTERGLIERIDGPGRAVRHRLTDEGERVRAAGSMVMDSVAADTIGRLSASEQRTLFRLLRKANPT